MADNTIPPSHRIHVQTWGTGRFRADLLLGHHAICETGYGASEEAAVADLVRATTGTGHAEALRRVLLCEERENEAND